MKRILISLLSLAGVASADFIWNGGAGTISADQWANQSNWTLTGNSTWSGTTGPGAPNQNSNVMYETPIIIRESITIEPVLEGWHTHMSIEGNSTVTAVFKKFQTPTISVSEGSTFNVTVNGDVKDGQTYTVNGTMVLDATDDNPLGVINLTLGDVAQFTLKNATHTVGTNSETDAFTLNAHLSGVDGVLSTRTLIRYENVTLNDYGNIVCNFGEGWTNVGEGTVNGVYQYKLVNTDAGLSVQYMVPEPATATLSLLALAGLAARRRRK